VSNLLGSSFRASLDQLIQTYVERQGHANMEWDPEEAAPSANLEQQSRDQIVDQEGTINSPLDLPSLPTPPTPPLWDQHPHGDNWSHNDVNMRYFSLGSASSNYALFFFGDFYIITF